MKDLSSREAQAFWVGILIGVTVMACLCPWFAHILFGK
jgi:hypothetical protein